MSKKEVFRLRSVKSLVIAPAKTVRRDSERRRAVSTTAQTNSGIRSKVIPVDRILITVASS